MMNAPLAAAAWLGQLGDPQIIAAVGAPRFRAAMGTPGPEWSAP